MGQEQSMSGNGKKDKFDYDRLEIAAIRDGDLAKFEDLLRLGLDVHNVNIKPGRTIFAACIKHQRWEFFQKALEHVKDPNAAGKGNVLLSQFVRWINPQELRFLRAFWAKFGEQVDVWKSGPDEVPSAIDLIRKEGNCFALYVLFDCVGPKLFEHKVDGGNLLNLSATDNKYRHVKALIACGCPTIQDNQGRTPLMNAALAERPHTFKTLLFAFPKLVNVPDNNGDTPLIVCIRNGMRQNFVNFLALFGADPLHENNNHVSALSLMKEDDSNNSRKNFCTLFGLPPLPELPPKESNKEEDESNKPVAKAEEQPAATSMNTDN